MSRIEILAPGGSFNSSLHAFEAGADAIYAGMTSFSARSGAANFSIETLRRLKGYCETRGKKIFIALNTLIRQDEMEEAIILLQQLILTGVDGVILQDLGLVRIIREFFPSLVIHASTQLAAHNSRGVAVLKKMGFSRVILARELTLEEIGIIREEHSDVELEVFIHGAMCYSFSGICLASGRLLGRSGNRGECGQICRTWFDGTDNHRFAFSANDMKAGEMVVKLAEMGIDSLKIEGRLKSPAYVSHTVAYYRALLDGSSRKIVNGEEGLSAVSFSRNQTDAFLANPKGRDMINNRFASHTGIPAGIVLSWNRGRLRIKGQTDLSERDGLLLFLEGEPRQFALKSAGKKKDFLKGETIEVLFPEPVPDGTAVALVSRHNLQLKEYKAESYKPWKTPIDLEVTLNPDGITIKAPLLTETVFQSEIHMEKSETRRDFSEILKKNFSKSADSSFSAADINLINNTDLSPDGIFIPPAKIKEIRRDFYNFLEQQTEKEMRDRASSISKGIDERLEGMPYPLWNGSIPARKDMAPFRGGEGEFHPLLPLQFKEEDFEKIERAITAIAGEGRKIAVGLNNISHLSLIDSFRNMNNIFFFTDYCLYGANRAAALVFREQSERMLFSYYWIEDREGNLPPFKTIEEDFNPHLFVSRICYRLHNGLGTCGDCSRDYSYTLKQRDREFTVVVRNCLTWLYQKV